ncbi:MAG: PqqD family protein [Rubricella sp.]
MSFVQNTADVSAEDFDGEVVLVNFTTGRYFSLRGAGAIFWKALEQPGSAETLAVVASRAYGDAAYRGDVEALLSQLAEQSLVLPSDADPVAPDTPVAGEDYAPPVLEVFDELEELIALDPIHDTEEGWPQRAPTAS